jgi:hypothetical protein
MEFEQALKNEIAKIRARLAELTSLDITDRRGGPVKSRSGRSVRKARRKNRVSAARRKQMQEHGVYLGVIRNLSTANKARVKKLRASKGVSAAIREARRLGTRKTSSQATKVPRQQVAS